MKRRGGPAPNQKSWAEVRFVGWGLVGGGGGWVAYGTPFVAYGVDEGAGEDGGEEVAEGVALLEHAGDEAAGFFGAVFERWVK